MLKPSKRDRCIISCQYLDMIGAWDPILGKMNNVVDQMIQKYLNERVQNQSGIKLSGDGTWIGKRMHVANFTLRVIYGNHHSD